MDGDGTLQVGQLLWTRCSDKERCGLHKNYVQTKYEDVLWDSTL